MPKLKKLDTMVLVNNQQEYDLLMKIYEWAGWTWRCGVEPTNKTTKSKIHFPVSIDIANGCGYSHQTPPNNKYCKISSTITLNQFFKKQKLTLNKAFAVPGLRVESKQASDSYTGTVRNEMDEFGIYVIRDNKRDVSEGWRCMITKNGDVATANALWDKKSYLKVIGYKPEGTNIMKVGQSVKIIGSMRAFAHNVGKVGVITHIRPDWPEDTFYIQLGDGKTDSVSPRDIELCNPSQFSELYEGYEFENGATVLFFNGKVAIIDAGDGTTDTYSESEFECTDLEFVDQEEAEVELSMDEVAKKFGVNVNKLKIKKQ